MIKSIDLYHFKSANELTIPLKKLSVLTGLNGSGKSSILQSIALIKQSYDLDTSGKNLALRGNLVNFGFSDDILFDGAKSDELRIAITTNSNKLQWKTEVKLAQDTLRAELDGNAESLKKLFTGFQFIQADRMTPAIQYQQAGSAERDAGSLGSHGELTVDFLSRNADIKVSSLRKYPEVRIKNPEELELMRSVSPTDSLLDTTAAWLQLLSPGVRPLAQLVDLSDSAALRFEYRGIEGDIAYKKHRPSNVGFGLTYILPIIVACLSAKSESILLLENPEAHLHPRGQAALGLLLSLCAQDGVQIIVETHSDHLLNGIRLAAKRNDIPADDIAVHFFSRDTKSGISTCESPHLLSNGRFSCWPAGFFDEWSNALDELLEE